MKTKLVIVAIFCAQFFSAQISVFQNQVNEGNLTSKQKITKELASNYITTQYFIQPNFKLNSDLKIKLPNQKEIVARFDKQFTYGNKSESYVYSIENEPLSELVLSKYDNIVTGMYAPLSGEKVMFHQTEGDIFALSLVSDQKILDQDSKDDYILDSSLSGYAKVNSDVCLSSTAVCPASRIDVMVVYTSAARTAWGGVSQSNSSIATAITNFNTALTNSGVTNVTINLIYAGEISYTEPGNINTDLTRLRTNNDGYMDDVHTLRTTYGADLVALVTGTPTNTCGLGYLNTNATNYSAANGFCVGLYNCVVSNYSLAHELGHNMGLQHDWYVNTSALPCSHHHGYTNRTAINSGTSSTSSQRWRTIMAYNDECAATGFNCTRINRWSNPNVNYNSEPTGIAIGNTNPSNEAYGFARFACVVSNFMPTASGLSTSELVTEAKKFSIYPNPAKETITITTIDDKKYSFKIINSIGQNIITTSDKTINIRSLSSGVYFVNIHDEKGTLVGNKKFIVE
ncbi:zinc-dependent metalloprotease [Chryseobacterium oryctis]|uniref:M12 family metallo-peptidase n=1 Tax=Chryseobacterium oryctis TaxID=2952618 RepID=A0ABT3HK31_9FLAO|nr:zinc-dependent metalloprotease [Chryseobacterium oryctis]MCW3160149.1 M12 family metallo-peptidase [Chryseobacterium oryctis]